MHFWPNHRDLLVLFRVCFQMQAGHRDRYEATLPECFHENFQRILSLGARNLGAQLGEKMAEEKNSAIVGIRSKKARMFTI